MMGKEDLDDKNKQTVAKEEEPSTPKTPLASSASIEGVGQVFGYGVADLMGRRAYMEDKSAVDVNVTKNPVSVFGVFDGHNGKKCSEFLKERLHKNIIEALEKVTEPRNRPEEDVFKSVLTEAFVKTDKEFIELASKEHLTDGSTGVVAVLHDQHLYVANTGDSRGVLCRAGKAVPMSEDHKPNAPSELERIKKAGGFVVFIGTWRVLGVLATSRAFGDIDLKQFVIPNPDIKVVSVTDEDEFFILGSDGLWDTFTNQQACDFIAPYNDGTADWTQKAAEAIVRSAYEKFSTDNITALVVDIKHHNKMMYTSSDKNKNSDESENEQDSKGTAKQSEADEDDMSTDNGLGAGSSADLTTAQAEAL